MVVVAFFKTACSYITQVDLEQSVLHLPQPPEGWDYRWVPPYLAHSFIPREVGDIYCCGPPGQTFPQRKPLAVLLEVWFVLKYV